MGTFFRILLIGIYTTEWISARDRILLRIQQFFKKSFALKLDNARLGETVYILPTDAFSEHCTFLLSDVNVFLPRLKTLFSCVRDLNICILDNLAFTRVVRGANRCWKYESIPRRSSPPHRDPVCPIPSCIRIGSPPRRPRPRPLRPSVGEVVTFEVGEGLPDPQTDFSAEVARPGSQCLPTPICQPLFVDLSPPLQISKFFV